MPVHENPWLAVVSFEDYEWVQGRPPNQRLQSQKTRAHIQYIPSASIIIFGHYSILIFMGRREILENQPNGALIFEG